MWTTTTGGRAVHWPPPPELRGVATGVGRGWPVGLADPSADPGFPGTQ